MTRPDLLTALEALEQEWREQGDRLFCRAGLEQTEAVNYYVCADQLAAVRARYAERTDEIATLRARVKNPERLLSVD